MSISGDEFFSHIGQSINDLILKHRFDLDRQRLITGAQRILKDKGFYLGEVTGELNPAMNAAVHQYLGRDHFRDVLEDDILGSLRTILDSESKTRWIDVLNSESKERWVDGTPEYSFHICGLRKLFPEARFVHLFRDVEAVVRSMLNFHRVGGIHLVANEEEGYRYWIRTVRACIMAEQAYGPSVVHRLQYAALIKDPDSAMRSLLDFVGEPFSARCLEPLAERINSSMVPSDFKSEHPATDPVIRENARRLSAKIEKTAQSSEATPATAIELESTFRESYLKTKTLERGLNA
jgi:hypothetical protein